MMFPLKLTGLKGHDKSFKWKQNEVNNDDPVKLTGLNGHK